jgi:hypothetical protein
VGASRKLRPDANRGLDLADEAGSRQAEASRQALRAKWADPAFRAQISALMKARWQDPAYREYAGSFRRDGRAYYWQHIDSGRIVFRTKLEMRQQLGLKAPALDDLVAGRIQTSRGWRIAPCALLSDGPRWKFK